MDSTTYHNLYVDQLQEAIDKEKSLYRKLDHQEYDSNYIFHKAGFIRGLEEAGFILEELSKQVKASNEQEEKR